MPVMVFLLIASVTNVEAKMFTVSRGVFLRMSPCCDEQELRTTAADIAAHAGRSGPSLGSLLSATELCGILGHS